MSEYIVEVSEWVIDANGNPPFGKNEQIVRCCDCGKWDADGEPHAIHPDRHFCDEFAHYVEPDGFCAWGERRSHEHGHQMRDVLARG